MLHCTISSPCGVVNFTALVSLSLSLMVSKAMCKIAYFECAAVDMVSGSNLGALNQSGQGFDHPDLDTAIAFFEKACDRGNALGCFNLGLAYDDGQGIDRDPDKPAILYRMACEGASGEGCVNLGVFYAHGTGVAVDLAMAATFYRQSCDSGNPKAASTWAACTKTAWVSRRTLRQQPASNAKPVTAATTWLATNFIAPTSLSTLSNRS